MTQPYRQLCLRLPDGLHEELKETLHEPGEGLLDGVNFTPDPTPDEKNKMKFFFKGKSYPARLVNLPCLVETHKTLDHVTYFKSGDVGQMLVVYQDAEAYQADDDHAVSSQDYFPDGLTPPTKNIVRRKFQLSRPAEGKYPKAEVARVEDQLMRLMNPSNSSLLSGTEYVHDELVDFEPWMLDLQAAERGLVTGIHLRVSSQREQDRGEKVLFGHELLSLHPDILLSKEENDVIQRELAPEPPSPAPPPQGSSPMPPPPMMEVGQLFAASSLSRYQS
ncbi:unnamed protein product [Chrysoparadoxa australica]